MKGGLCTFQLRMGDQPLVSQGDRPDLLLAFDDQAYQEHGRRLPDGGLLVYDQDVFPVQDGRLRAFGIPLTTIAQKELNFLPGRNILAVGALGGLLSMEYAKLEQVVRQALRHKVQEVVAKNLLALESGYRRELEIRPQANLPAFQMLDNSIYAQTKGHSSPTTSLDWETASMPYGTIEDPLNPIAMAIAYGVTFVARGYAARSQQFVELVMRAMDHRGFSFIHVISPCVTHHDVYKDMLAKVVDIPAEHDPSDKTAAFRLSQEEERVPLGVFYQVQRPPFHQRLEEIRHKAQPDGPVTVEELLARFK